MLTPLYVYLKRNGKFVAVKAPLDFFDPEELSKYHSFENFFTTEFVDQVLPFRDAARSIRSLLNWQPPPSPEKSLIAGEQLGISPYELSDAVLRLLGPLFSPKVLVEPFFLSILANEICEPVESSYLRDAREKSVERLELALLRSGIAVTLALILGNCSLAHLNRIRRESLDRTLGKGGRPVGLETDAILKLSEQLLEADLTLAIGEKTFEGRVDRLSQKIFARFERIRTKLVKRTASTASILGPRGFKNV